MHCSLANVFQGHAYRNNLIYSHIISTESHHFGFTTHSPTIAQKVSSYLGVVIVLMLVFLSHVILLKTPAVQKVTDIPAPYLILAEVFSKAKATELPPHCPWDSAIDLLSGSVPPRYRAYLCLEYRRSTSRRHSNRGAFTSQCLLWPQVSLCGKERW